VLQWFDGKNVIVELRKIFDVFILFCF
jgi:hypothetical protein